MDDRQILIALNASESLHRGALCRLTDRLDAWRHGPRPTEIRRLAPRLGIDPRSIRRAVTLLPRAGQDSEEELAKAEAEGCEIVTRLDPGYPRQLLDHSLPPPVLYIQGRLPTAPAVAIVGSRKMTPYGERAATRFARGLASSGVCVVSGFARGVDSTAHRAAAEADGGSTVAVLGCGLDVDYPRGNRELRRTLAANGALVSEFPLGAQPLPWRFPIRNRVIAALAVGVLVIQAAPRSGSLITAHQALELGRDVYAVPGSIFDPLSEGTHGLIADGAFLARQVEDVLDTLPLALQQQLFPTTDRARRQAPPAVAAGRPPLKGFAGRLLEALSDDEPHSAEELAALLDAAVDKVLASLLELELGGWIRRLPGPVYTR